MYIKKKAFVLLITYLLAAVIALGGWAIYNGPNGRAYKNTAAYGYEHAFSEVVLAVKNLDSALHRGSYTQGVEMSSEISADIYADCLAAEMTMAALPFSTQELEQTAGFIGVVGDYAKALLRDCARFGFGEKERENLAALREISSELTEKLSSLQDDVDNGDVTMDEPENVFADNSSASLLSAAFLEFEGDFPELPELDYDGKYNKAEVMEECDNVSEDEAKKAASELFGIDEEKLELKYESENGARCFASDGKSIVVNGGGKVLSMSCGRVAAGDMSADEMEEKGVEFIKNAGFSDMELVSSESSGGVQRLEFCCRQNDVLCTCDSIKLSIASDNGEVYSFDATDYVKNHSEREKTQPAVSSNIARAALPASLFVKNEELIMCQTEGGNEKLCYAFECEGEGGEKVRVCVDASSGEQYKIEF